MNSSLNIGLVSYALTPGLVFVRLPNERGRWVLTDRCVVEVDCPLCMAVSGEPCRRNWDKIKRGMEASPKYGVGVHIRRRQAAQQKFGTTQYASRAKPHKVRLTQQDLVEAQAPMVDEPGPPSPYETYFEITPRKP